MGQDVRVGTIVVPENKTVENIISNHEEITEQIGEIMDTVNYFAAKSIWLCEAKY